MLKPFTDGWHDECWGRMVVGIGAGKARDVLSMILTETASDRYNAGENAAIELSSLHDITAENLVKRVLANLTPRNTRKGEKKMRWVVVMETFALGSTYSKDLCRKYDLDPDEMLKR